MRAREERRKVLVKGRVLVGTRWSDACVLNMSSRGMLLQMQMPPSRGEYIEFRRGQHIVIARVVWSQHHRLGVRAQDPLAIDSLVADASQPVPGRPAPTSEHRERRSSPRPSLERHEHNRMVARSVQYAGVVGVAACASFFAFDLVSHALSAPLIEISAVLPTTK